jgi:hypothetical protein
MKATAQPISNRGVNSASALKEVLVEVERDEAEAISLLVNLLAKVRETSATAPLNDICKVMKEWQNQPPRVIVGSLMKISEQFEGQCPAYGKK